MQDHKNKLNVHPNHLFYS